MIIGAGSNAAPIHRRNCREALSYSPITSEAGFPLSKIRISI